MDANKSSLTETPQPLQPPPNRDVEPVTKSIMKKEARQRSQLAGEARTWLRVVAIDGLAKTSNMRSFVACGGERRQEEELHNS